jgi:hypothetical protein
MHYDIKRGSEIIANVYPAGQREKEIMIKNIVPFSFKSPVSIEFEIGDNVTVWGETYYLNQLDEPTKNQYCLAVER